MWPGEGIIRPTEEELGKAIREAKDAGESSTDIKHTDKGAGMVRFYLGPKYLALPLDEIRKLVEKLSRSGKEPAANGAKPRKRREQFDLAIRRMLKCYPPAPSHSPEYEALHRSEEWREFLRDLKSRLDYHCQGCWQIFLGAHLEGHCLDYAHWRAPGRVLILCRACHPVFDAQKRRAADKGPGDSWGPLAGQEDD